MAQAVIAADAVAGLDLAGYLTTDAKRSIAFYRDVLGITPSWVDDEGRGAEFGLADGQTLGIWDTGEGKTGAFAFFGVKDAKAAVARIRKAGGTISDAEDTPMCFMAFGSDPDGNSYAVHQRKDGTVGSDVVTPKRDSADVVGLDLTGYPTSDAKRSVAFYSDVVGITPTSVDDEDRGSEFELADGTVFGVWNGGEQKYTGGVMLAVGDLAAAITRIRERGGQISDAMESPVCHMAFIKDPDGNDIIVHQRKGV